MGTEPIHFVYLHGFLSSPASAKAVQTQRYFAAHHRDVQVHVPRVSPNPAESRPALQQLIRSLSGSVALIGSSMGGYHATALAAEFQCPAVLINPFVWQESGRAGFLGTHVASDGRQVVVDEAMLDDFARLAPQPPSPGSALWVLLQTGDETLDYTVAETFYKGCTLTVASGGHHQFDGWGCYLPAVADWLGPRCQFH